MAGSGSGGPGEERLLHGGTKVKRAEPQELVTSLIQGFGLKVFYLLQALLIYSLLLQGLQGIQGPKVSAETPCSFREVTTAQSDALYNPYIPRALDNVPRATLFRVWDSVLPSPSTRHPNCLPPPPAHSPIFLCSPFLAPSVALTHTHLHLLCPLPGLGSLGFSMHFTRCLILVS